VIKRGQVYWVALDPTVGSEIQKTRPAVVVSNDVGNTHSPLVTVLPITSKAERIYPFEVEILRGQGRLKEGGKIKANLIRTIDKKRLRGRPLGQMPPTVMRAVNEAIKIHLALD
jgi:mRNA interferase MazF